MLATSSSRSPSPSSAYDNDNEVKQAAAVAQDRRWLLLGALSSARTRTVPYEESGSARLQVGCKSDFSLENKENNVIAKTSPTRLAVTLGLLSLVVPERFRLSHIHSHGARSRRRTLLSSVQPRSVTEMLSNASLTPLHPLPLKKTTFFFISELRAEVDSRSRLSPQGTKS